MVQVMSRASVYFYFFFNDTATTEIYTLSLHDALPISLRCAQQVADVRHGGAPLDRRRLDREAARRVGDLRAAPRDVHPRGHARDRKSTRLNSSHANISYAVFCLKKKKTAPLSAYSQVQ